MLITRIEQKMDPYCAQGIYEFVLCTRLKPVAGFDKTTLPNSTKDRSYTGSGHRMHYTKMKPWCAQKGC